jgi:hypothetical protein
MHLCVFTAQVIARDYFPMDNEEKVLSQDEVLVQKSSCLLIIIIDWVSEIILVLNIVSNYVPSYLSTDTQLIRDHTHIVADRKFLHFLFVSKLIVIKHRLAIVFRIFCVLLYIEAVV